MADSKALLRGLLRELSEEPELSPEQHEFLARLLSDAPEANGLSQELWHAVRALERAAVGYSHCYERLRLLLDGGFVL